MSSTQPDNSALPEIRSLRRLIRHTQRSIRHGTIDYLAAARLIARLTEALSTLLQAEHRLNPPKSPKSPEPIRPFNPFDDPNYQLPTYSPYDPEPQPYRHYLYDPNDDTSLDPTSPSP